MWNVICACGIDISENGQDVFGIYVGPLEK